jgi:hypothetical protein
MGNGTRLDVSRYTVLVTVTVSLTVFLAAHSEHILSFIFCVAQDERMNKNMDRRKNFIL